MISSNRFKLFHWLSEGIWPLEKVRQPTQLQQDIETPVREENATLTTKIWLQQCNDHHISCIRHSLDLQPLSRCSIKEGDESNQGAAEGISVSHFTRERKGNHIKK